MLVNIRILSMNGRPRPDRALELSFQARCMRMGATEFGFHLGLEGECVIGARSVSSAVRLKAIHFSNNLARFEDGQEVTGEILVSLTTEAIAWIEEQRAANDVSVVLRLALVWQEASLVQPGHPSLYTSGAVHVSSQTPSFTIPQSDWIRLLSQMECSEWWLIELPVQPLLSDPYLKAGLEYLTGAEKLLRQGDYDGCMADCRRSFESIAKHHVPGDSRRGYDRLLERAFVTEAEQPKRELVRPLLKALSDLIHPLGRHATAPPIPVTRAEAEMVLATSMSILSMITRAIVSNEQQQRVAIGR